MSHPGGGSGGSGSGLDPLRRALLSLERTQARVRELEEARRVPLAIVGIGCRMPAGGDDADRFLDRLIAGEDGVVPAPPVSRPGWPSPDAGGEALPPAGYLQEDVRGFDPGFFGISPREAAAIDPQHRLVLECAWEALEHAGIDPRSLHGSATGVYLGMAGNDYANLQLQSPRADALLHSHFASGTGHSMASGRIAYLLGLQGPAVTVDTACSSSLVALHLACQALRAGEVGLALAAGVNLILSPDYTKAFHRARMLAPDGRCKTFDAAADGFGRAEGCGVLVLKRLPDALRDGDRVLALVRGSAVNQDGPSSGLTAPNGPAQEAVIRAALASAGLRPGEIDYVEAHGTGTELGDPIEIRALGNVFRGDRPPERPLRIGSVKSNVGHLEAAAGVAGVIKVAAALRRGVLPGNLHFREASPHIPWEGLPLEVVSASRPFPGEEGRPRRAGVSSFGFSGTNAHVILEEAPGSGVGEGGQEESEGRAPAHRESEGRESTGRGEEGIPRVLPLSAATPGALEELAAAVASHLRTPGDRFGDRCFTAAAGRAHHEHRLALVATSGEEAAAALDGWLRDSEAPRIVRTGRADPRGVPAPAFLFTGQGAQHPGMGWGLLERSPLVRRTLQECDDLLREELEVPLLALLDPDGPAADLVHRTDLTQPALFALQVALVRLWESWGVRPSVVLGHSIGEYAAAWAAGVFSLEDALKVVAARGRLMHEAPGSGRMLAVMAPEDRVLAWLAEEAGREVSLAGVNAPAQVVVSGAADAVGALEARAAAEGVSTRPVRASHAFHSPLMDGVVPALREVLRGVTLRPADRVRFVSTVTGRPVAPAELADPEYWATQVRLPVRFSDAVASMIPLAPRALEVGPHPTLSGLVSLGGSGLPVTPSLRRDRDPWTSLQEAVAELYAAGLSLDWRGIEPRPGARVVDLPRYPFQREPLWFDGEAGAMDLPGAAAAGAAAGLAPDPDAHPLLGSPLVQPGGDRSFQSVLSAEAPAFIGEHRVLERPLLPGTAFLEMGLAAGRAARGGTVELREVEFLVPMDFGSGARRVHTRVEGSGRFTVHSAPLGEGAAGEADWTLHCSGLVEGEGAGEGAGSGGVSGPGESASAGHAAAAGRMAASAGAPVEPSAPVEEIRSRCPQEVDPAEFREGMARRGYRFGPLLGGIRELRVGEGEVLARVELPAGARDDALRYGAHPLLLDAAVQAVGAALRGPEAGRTWVPLAVDRVHAPHPLPTTVEVHAVVRTVEGGTLRAHVRLLAPDGAPLALLEGMAFRPLRAGELAGGADPFLHVRWVPVAPEGDGGAGGSVGSALAELAATLDAAGYDRFVESLEARSGELARGALLSMGWHPAAGEEVEVEALAGRLGVVPAHRRLFARILEILGEEGILQPVGSGGYRVVEPLEAGAEGGAGAGAPLPGDRVEARLLERCGAALPELLRGSGDALELLFPGGSTGEAEALYHEAPFARVFNGALAAALVEEARKRRGRPLRVLEVGAGTGGTTRRILEGLDAEGVAVEYTFTDVSPLFLDRARRRWADRSDLRYALLDLDRSAEEQGFRPGAFDVVVAANCLHAARDVRGAVAGVEGLLDAGGLLAAVEVFAPHRWFDLTVGLTEGWWHFADPELRPSYPCIGAPEWLGVLEEVGMVEARVLPLSETGVTSGPAARGQGLVLARRPAASPAEAGDPSSLPWLVVADEGKGEVVEGLRSRGEPVEVASPATVAEVLGEAPAWRGVVLVEPGGGSGSMDPDVLLPAVRTGVEAMLEVVGAVAREEVRVGGLFLVGRGAQVATSSDVDVDPAGAVAWGVARTLEQELPELPVRRLDLESTPAGDEERRVVDWLLGTSAEPELALRSGRLLARRLVAGAPPRTSLPEEYRLDPPGAATLDALSFHPGRRTPPGPGQVEIRVVASGVNFKDVLNVLGMYPGDAGPLGSECAGVVTAVGEGVDLPVGTAVVAAAGHAYGRHVLAEAHLVARKPAGLPFARAAGLPVAYLTAHFALNHLGRMQAGERVLVHAAAGGVGMAALRLALDAGARVLATAGSPEKRAWLLEQGAEAVFDSRSGAFAAGVLEATGGEGVHLVLNSLADDLVDRSFDCIARGGRFLEIGKRGIWSPERVAALGREIEYHVIDWGETARRDPETVGRLLREVLARVEEGGIPPLPVTTWPVDEAASAFRFMARGLHTGKLVLLHPVLDDLPALDPGAADGAWLVTGGTGGLGLATAERAAERGLRHLVLVSRRGVPPENRERVAALEAKGVRIRVVEADVGDPAGIRTLVVALREEGVERLAGVIHAAGALSDRALPRSSWADFQPVLRAKVEGTARLAAGLEPFRPGFFVAYSSVASVLGAPGQANHAGANAFLDTFAATRWAEGQVGMSLAWGPWTRIGAAAAPEALERARQRGLEPLEPEEGLAWLEHALAHPRVLGVGTRVSDVAALDRSGSPLLSEMARSRAASGARPGARPDGGAERRQETGKRPVAEATYGRPAAPPSFRSMLAAAPPGDRRRLLLERVRMRIRGVLGLGADAPLDPDRPLGEIGLDSLLAVELRNALAEELELRLPATLLFDHATPGALAAHLLERVAPEEGGEPAGKGSAVGSRAGDGAPGAAGGGPGSTGTAPGPTGSPSPATPRTGALDALDALDDLDDDEVERLLAEKLRPHG